MSEPLKAAYLLAALCPFTASYVAAPLSETLAICCVAHALYYGVRGLKALEQDDAWPASCGPLRACGARRESSCVLITD